MESIGDTNGVYWRVLGNPLLPCLQSASSMISSISMLNFTETTSFNLPLRSLRHSELYIETDKLMLLFTCFKPSFKGNH